MAASEDEFAGAGTVFWRTGEGLRVEINKRAAELLDEELRAKGWLPE